MRILRLSLIAALWIGCKTSPLASQAHFPDLTALAFAPPLAPFTNPPAEAPTSEIPVTPVAGTTGRISLLTGLVAIPVGAIVGAGLCRAFEVDDDGTVAQCAVLGGAVSLPVGIAAGYGVGRGQLEGWAAAKGGALWGGGFGLAAALATNAGTAAGDGAFSLTGVLGFALGAAVVGAISGSIVG